ncbi:hypothetical protein [Thermocatellispora tengchongensis]|uniref:hypothetical protein n=1 Tax=Thermocatellispora tengchongensis TaxID=1073253 RepID=UPI003625BCC6
MGPVLGRIRTEAIGGQARLTRHRLRTRTTPVGPLAAADAGDASELWVLAEKREKEGTDDQWSDLLRYGLEADGRVADPW